MNTRICYFLLASIFISYSALAQITPSKELMNFYTGEWKGERMEDGRPKVSAALIERVKKLSLEEIWGTLRNEGYRNQYEGNWEIIHPDQIIAGRALTAVYMPKRPDVDKKILDKGHNEGRIGASNSWPIDMLKEGDVYVADAFGKIIDGTLIGDNLGNSIYAKSKNGVVFDGGARDLQGLAEIEGFNAYVRGFHPSYLQEAMLTGINVPIRIGNAVCMPGDIVLAKKGGVIFIPPHLLEKVVLTGEFVALRDKFGHQMLRTGKYTPGQIDAQWTDEIKKSFIKWLDENPKELSMSRQELDDYMKSRTW